MPCTPTTIPGGFTALVCTRRGRSLRCQCGAAAPLMCDWPTPERKSGTCDKGLCNDCRRRDGGDKDYCPFHRGSPPQTQAEMDLAGEDAANEAARILGVTR